MKRIALDCETNLAHDVIHVCVTQDIDTGETRVWKAPNGLWDYLKDATLIAGHNLIGFDGPILNRLWKTKIGLKQAYDTLVVSRLLEPTKEKGHSLDAWGNELGVKKIDYKAVWQWLEGKREEYSGECFDKPHPDLLEHYCVRDVDVLVRLYNRLRDDVEAKGFSEESVLLEHQVASIIAVQERNGFKLDVPYATSLLASLKTRMSLIYDKMQEQWPPYERERFSEKTGKQLKSETVTFNPASRKQIGEKLISLGWKPKKFTEQGQPIVDESTLMELKIKEAQPIAEYLMLQKRIAQIESWIDALGSDGRVHGKVITNGAVTGRMTHSSPNMAQIPAVRKDDKGNILVGPAGGYGVECRQCWTVEEGNVLVGCDASGLELRMLAHYMKDENYVKTVTEGSSKEGTDVHTVNQKAAGLQTRDQAKTFIYAFLYGAGPAKIGSIVGGSAKAGQKLIDAFLKGTPALQRLRNTVSTYASKGYVPGLDGRKIWVRSEHAALNSLLQGAGAIVMKKALVLFNNHKVKNKWENVKYVANVHDELQIECPEGIAEDVGKAARQAIIQAGVEFNLRCPLDGEYKIGRNWRETH
jgi:DNA polymerase I-like protein with 3'-5' exonuclease and polymerase domains